MSPETWFIPNISRSNWTRYLGAAETSQAFQDPALWGKAIEACDVIGVYVDVVRETATGTDGYLVNLVAMANLYGKKIAIEVGGPYGVAPNLDTGAESATWDITTSIANIVALGGTVDYLAMDHPHRRVIEGLGQTLAQAVAQVVEYIETIHATYPAIGVGLLTQLPLWDYNGKLRYSGVAYGYEFDDCFTDTMTAVNAASEELAFLRVDFPYEYANAIIPSSYKDTDHWVTRLAAMQTAAIAADVPFGLILNTPYGGGGSEGHGGTYPGAPFAGSDEAFQKYTLRFAEQVRRLVEHGRLAPQDHLVIQSWYHYPRDLAPDTVPYTFCDTFLKAKAVFETGA